MFSAGLQPCLVVSWKLSQQVLGGRWCPKRTTEETGALAKEPCPLMTQRWQAVVTGSTPKSKQPCLQIDFAGTSREEAFQGSSWKGTLQKLPVDIWSWPALRVFKNIARELSSSLEYIFQEYKIIFTLSCPVNFEAGGDCAGAGGLYLEKKMLPCIYVNQK